MSQQCKEEQVDESICGLRILRVDAAGTPVQWLSPKSAISHVAQNQILWSLGEDALTFHGGIQRVTGKESVLSAPAILAIKGHEKVRSYISNNDILPLHRSYLFRRDRYMCAYCGQIFTSALLTIEHVTPRARGGKDAWENVVSACRSCNQKKDCRTPEEANMPLLYLPYAPNRFEHFILSIKSQHILSDQMEYLLKKVGKNSRFKN